MHFTKVSHKTTFRQVRMVYHHGYKFGYAIFWKVFIHQKSGAASLRSIAAYYIFRARIFAIQLLESPRIHLLSWFVRKADDLFVLRRSRLGQPNQDASVKYLSHPLSINLAEFSPREKWLELQHLCLWLFLQCLCFWRTRSWIQSKLAREKPSPEAFALYLEVLTSP